MSVCSAVRRVLLLLPTALTSLKSRAHASPFSAGGGPGRNCEALAISQGLRCDHWVTAGVAVGTYAAAVVCGRCVSGVPALSSRRCESTAVAALSPAAIPAVLAAPSDTDTSA